MIKRKDKKSSFGKRRRCEICELKYNYIDFKDVEFLNKYVSGTGQIKPRLTTGACAKDQRKIAMAIKRARYIALMPYTKDRVRVLKNAIAPANAAANSQHNNQPAAASAAQNSADNTAK
ncbi:30S ribosomal protein S18 [Mycoplasmopsis columbinasalis]|uniref:Small ribosomal subunit protein bS18 n=1 Tax=Mycoplasmopsis columbinasalis TaxID=114880 RepID=A0A449B9F7_9BACT|nr:30S ribosomal protein S18 [Mycoplasmopsis columbinasalis]